MTTERQVRDSRVPGLALAAAVAGTATLAGWLVPAGGAPLFAIVIGCAIALWRPVPDRMAPGLAFCSRPVLQASVVILGAMLSLGQIVSIGTSSLPVLLGTLGVALVLAPRLGRALRLPPDVSTLVGVGTAICGASAIAATNSVIEADDSDVAYAVSTIFLFNIVALLTYPALGHALGLSQRSFGLWAGTAINDLSSVVAASTIYGHAATTQAVVVKLTRTLAIIPVSVALAVRRRGGRGVAAGRAVPLFLVGFVALAAVNSAGLIPAAWHPDLSRVSTWLITVALGAIGLSTRPAAIRRAGWRPLILGAALWLAVGGSSLLLQAGASRLGG